LFSNFRLDVRWDLALGWHINPASASGCHRIVKILSNVGAAAFGAAEAAALQSRLLHQRTSGPGR